MLARFGRSQQEREDQTAPLVNGAGLESVFTELLSQLQGPNLESQSCRGFQEHGRVISQIHLDHRQQQQSQASLSTLQSLMTGAPALATQTANTALHRQEPSLDLCQLMSLGFALEQALECYIWVQKDHDFGPRW